MTKEEEHTWLTFLQRIDDIKNKINENDYRLLMRNLKELKVDNDKIKNELEKVKPKYFITLGFKIRYNKYYSNKYNFSTINCKSTTRQIFYRTKLNKEEIIQLSKMLDVAINGDEEEMSNIINNYVSSIWLNLYNISNELSRRENISAKICEECVDECFCDCCDNENYELKFIDMINHNISITLDNIIFKGDDWINISGADCAYDYIIDKGKYFKDYMDKYTFKTYIEKIMKWVDERI